MLPQLASQIKIKVVNTNEVPPERLSQIHTQWSRILQAHQSTSAADVAQGETLQQYSGAVYRYLCGALKNADTAEDLAQEFALRFVRGDFRRAAPDKGRFRDYLKTVLINLVNEHWRKENHRVMNISPAAIEPALGAKKDSPSVFEDCLRDDLMEKTWQALRQTNEKYFRVLRIRVEYPDFTSGEIAERLFEINDVKISSGTVRKDLKRSRELFAELLLDQAARTLDEPSADALREALKELRLLSYCEAAWFKRFAKKT